MSRVRLAILAFFGLLLLSSATTLRADSIDQFTYTSGGNTFSWQLPASPTVSDSSAGQYFEVSNVAYSLNGGAPVMGTFDFYSLSTGGGFDMYSGAMSTLWISAFGLQVYSGNENSPLFIPGTYTFLDFSKGILPSKGTLTIKTVSVPEPSAALLLLAGLAGLGLALKMKKSVA